MHYENSIEHVDCEIAWKMSPDYDSLWKMQPELKAFLFSGKAKQFGNSVFRYIGFYRPGRASSLWLLNYYKGIEFMSLVREKRKKSS